MSDPQTDQESTPETSAAAPETETANAPVAAAEPEAEAAAPIAAAAPSPASVVAAPAGPYAVIKTGGKQYRVKAGDRILVERLPAEAGSEITIDEVLLVGGAGTTKVGAPLVAGAHVAARVEDHPRGEKIVVFKYKPKKRYRRRTGHRQSLTRLTITDVVAG